MWSRRALPTLTGVQHRADRCSRRRAVDCAARRAPPVALEAGRRGHIEGPTMKHRIKSLWAFCPTLAAAALAVTSVAATRPPDATAFAAENDAAMARMMKGMHVRPSGNIDRDFATMMIPHHQGAIDMARAELRHGSNERLRRLAQEIVVAQQQEITVMQTVLDEELPVPGTARTHKP